ncbi:MAG: alkaline phosphatase family protein [Planctomycetes bacterium]|nr:alkaline phosphatase family protein [Planctomycetota bacterium]
MQDSSSEPGSSALAAAAAAVFTICLAIALSAPSLTSPIWPGFLFVWLFPAVLALVVGSILKRLPGLKQGQLAGLVTTAVVALPWMLVAGAPLAIMPWIFWPGMLVALGVSVVLHKKRNLSAIALAAGAVICMIPQDSKIELGGGELNPLVVVGMDSANWRFIDEMIAANPDDLPALQELMKTGVFAELESETPTASARIWTIIATGVGHEKNGIKNFGNFRYQLTAGRIWDAVIGASPGDPVDASDPIGTAGVVSWLINTPFAENARLAFNTPGWVVGSHEAKPEAANSAKILEGMGEDAANRPSIGMALTAMRSAMAVASADHAWAHINDAISVVFGEVFQGFNKEDLTWRMKIMRDRINADTYFALARRHGPDFNALVLYGNDQLGHYFWKYHEALYGNRELFPSVTDYEIKLRGEAIRDSYRACDRILGKLLKRVDREQVTLMLCSDHGMQPLEESRGDQQLTLRGAAVLKAVGGDPFVEMFTNANMDRALYISPQNPGEDGLEALNHLRGVLEEARDLTANQALFTVSFAPDKDDTLRVDFMDHAKSGLLAMDNELQIGDTVGKASQLYAIEERSGRHTLTGFFLMNGPGVKQGAKLDPVSIYDLAPTMAYVMGKKVPEDLPGKVITKAFTEDHLNGAPVRTKPGGFPDPPTVRSDTEEEIDRSSNKMGELGYVDNVKSKPKPKNDAENADLPNSK